MIKMTDPRCKTRQKCGKLRSLICWKKWKTLKMNSSSLANRSMANILVRLAFHNSCPNLEKRIMTLMNTELGITTLVLLSDRTLMSIGKNKTKLMPGRAKLLKRKMLQFKS